MRQDLFSPNLVDAAIKSATLSHARHVLNDGYMVRKLGPLVCFFDPNGADREVNLPENEEGLFYTIANVGVGFNLLVKDAAGTLLATVAPTQTLQVWSSESEWQGTKATTDLDVFTNTVNGLVPAPNSVTPGSLFLRDDGQWAQVQVVGIVDAFKYMSDGTNIAVGAGPDTFRFRSSTSQIGITVTNNEAVFGDNVNLSVNEAFVNHNALLNYVADQHVAHSSVSISAGIGLTGGGTIAANRTLALDVNGLGVIVPVLGDSIPFYDLSGTTHGKTTFTVLNGILDHNALLNYVADRHVAHSGVSIIAGTGLSGGGDISASRTLNLNINGLTADTLATADEFAFYDASGADHNKVTFGNLNASLDHNSLLNYSANRHIDHTAVSITGTGMLAGGGNIDASRTLNLASAAATTVLANITGGAAVPTANTITQLLDALIGSTRGMIAVRKTSAWQSLALGANNTYLKSDGTDLVYSAIAAGGDVVGPASATNNGFAKYDGTTGKLIKDSAAVVAIADGGTGQTSASAALSALGGEPSYATGTAMLFVQTSAPTGYTKGATHNDKALRVVTGAAGSGGTSAFSTVFGKTATDSHALTTSQLPTVIGGTTSNTLYSITAGESAVGTAHLTGSGGSGIQNSTGGSGHTHGMDIRVQYVDVIIATKN